MKLHEAMIAWTPAYLGSPRVKCGPHPVGNPDWTDPYACTNGACLRDWRALGADERPLRLLAMFAAMTAYDGMPAAMVHNAFLEIDEYREAMPADARQEVVA